MLFSTLSKNVALNDFLMPKTLVMSFYFRNGVLDLVGHNYQRISASPCIL